VPLGPVVKELDLGVGLRVEDGGIVHYVGVLEPGHLHSTPFRNIMSNVQKTTCTRTKMYIFTGYDVVR
jgi:hypothetical protein